MVLQLEANCKHSTLYNPENLLIARINTCFLWESDHIEIPRPMHQESFHYPSNLCQFFPKVLPPPSKNRSIHLGKYPSKIILVAPELAGNGVGTHHHLNQIKLSQKTTALPSLYESLPTHWLLINCICTFALCRQSKISCL